MNHSIILNFIKFDKGLFMKFLLIFLTTYLVLRYVLPLLIRLVFADLISKQQKKSDFKKKSSNSKSKKSNEKYGEYIDYEDID